MRTFFKFMPLIVIAVVACVKTPNLDYHSPNFEMPKFPDLKLNLSDITTCDKRDAEKTVSADDMRNRILVDDTIANKDLETVDCDGKVVTKSHGPIRDLIKNLKIDAPEGIPAGSISSFEVKNSRTCVTKEYEARDASKTKDSSQQIVLDALSGGTADLKGNLSIELSASELILSSGLNVREGLNVIEVTYLGKCEQFDNNKAKCLKYPELGKKTVVLDVQIKHPEVPGVLRTVQCDKK